MNVNNDRSDQVQICLFCHEDSSLSKSVEHVLPESLGNTTMVLPPGIVCDNCNNYFARKIEAPLLTSDSMISLRYFENIPNKRGHTPSLHASVKTSLGVPGELHTWSEGPLRGVLSLPAPVSFEIFQNDNPFEIAIDGPDSIPRDATLGRFICKIALESAAYRCYHNPLAYRSLLETDDWTGCRLHARYGTGPIWPVRVRRIYSPDRRWLDGSAKVQRVWESDFLLTPTGQLIFAIAIFGLEFTINCLEGDLAPYDAWLVRMHCPSLLYPDGLPAEPND